MRGKAQDDERTKEKKVREKAKRARALAREGGQLWLSVWWGLESCWQERGGKGEEVVCCVHERVGRE
eukprot:3730281-Rhodomonas_salina.1